MWTSLQQTTSMLNIKSQYRIQGSDDEKSLSVRFGQTLNLHHHNCYNWNHIYTYTPQLHMI